jgi:DNA-binding NtrC family response regulator
MDTLLVVDTGKGFYECQLAIFRHALALHRGCVTKAARQLGVTRKTFYNNLPELNRKPPEVPCPENSSVLSQPQVGAPQAG